MENKWKYEKNENKKCGSRPSIVLTPIKGSEKLKIFLKDQIWGNWVCDFLSVLRYFIENFLYFSRVYKIPSVFIDY